MRVIHIVPGSGGTFYCQNCMRDSALVKALRKRGHDVIMVPMYLPLFTDEPDLTEDTPVFFGGINVYLQQEFGLFRKTPRWLDKLLDSKWLLKKAAQREGSTNAADLGPMTLSMLNGEDGNQRKELDRLVAWLSARDHPDVVHISNSLLIGLAGALKKALGAPLVCTLQDEDTWLDAMAEPDKTRCWEAMSALCRNVDAFVAVSDWYGERMTERMALDPGRVHTVHIGVELAGVSPAPLDFDPPTLGFLSRMSPALGLDNLLDAFLALRERPALKNLRLRVTGGMTPADVSFVAGLREKLVAHGADQDVEFLGSFEREDREAFWQTVDVLSVPVKGGEAFGTYIIEALAHGVPVVQPKAGAFPELIGATGGGVVYDEDRGESLQDALASLLLEPDKARSLGAAGRAAVLGRFSIERMAQQMEEVYESVSSRRERTSQ